MIKKNIPCKRGKAKPSKPKIIKIIPRVKIRVFLISFCTMKVYPNTYFIQN